MLWSPVKDNVGCYKFYLFLWAAPEIFYIWHSKQESSSGSQSPWHSTYLNFRFTSRYTANTTQPLTSICLPFTKLLFILFLPFQLLPLGFRLYSFPFSESIALFLPIIIFVTSLKVEALDCLTKLWYRLCASFHFIEFTEAPLSSLQNYSKLY